MVYIGDYTLVGCYPDSPAHRALGGGPKNFDKGSVESCAAFCAQYEYPYAGITYMSQCMTISYPARTFTHDQQVIVPMKSPPQIQGCHLLLLAQRPSARMPQTSIAGAPTAQSQSIRHHGAPSITATRTSAQRSQCPLAITSSRAASGSLDLQSMAYSQPTRIGPPAVAWTYARQNVPLAVMISRTLA